MILLEDRRALAAYFEQARRAGAWLQHACATAGIDVRSFQRWKAPVAWWSATTGQWRYDLVAAAANTQIAA